MIIKLLIDEGADVNSLDTHQRNSLVYAIERNDIGLVRLLIDRGIEVNNTDIDRCDPIKSAIDLQHIPMIKYLLRHGASTTADRKRGNRLMMMACDIGDNDMFDIIVERGISMNEKDDKSHNVVVRAYLARQLDMAKRLLLQYNYKKSINQKDKIGDTLLNIAIKHEDYNFVKFLLDLCTDINFDERNNV